MPVPRFVLTVEVCPDRRLPPEGPAAPAPVTLRRACKQLWRSFRIKVVGVVEVPASEKEE
jgi:hypothetical protein